MRHHLCVGRRNWLFADTVHSANASANLYSLLQTCRVNNIDGYRQPQPREAQILMKLVADRLPKGNCDRRPPVASEPRSTGK